MREYAVETSFIFSGTFIIKAQDKEEAKEYVEKHCGLVIGGNIHTTLPDEDVDWDFPVHPDKEIGQIRVNKVEKCYE
jgi:hypothetical protein